MLEGPEDSTHKGLNEGRGAQLAGNIKSVKPLPCRGLGCRAQGYMSYTLHSWYPP